ncbi:MAG: glutathione peroxidase [Bacteroidetes bacterium]|nr:glutathione peroxidase [Bacteroidota bacterium]MBS1756489.1 glutathione peroxidase [Bacteroidota bacterium]
MTIRQKILHFIYPAFKSLTGLSGKNNKTLKSTTMAPQSFYDLQIILNNDQALNFSSLKNKKILLVNTASDCGYTRQYDGLQQLHEKYKDSLVIIGFPSNDFGEQEKGTDDTIATFCKTNYGVTFPLAKKSVVKKIAGQNVVYQWLTDENKNGWNDTAPNWNFCKYLIDTEGNLTHFFESGIEPMEKELINAIEE